MFNPHEHPINEAPIRISFGHYYIEINGRLIDYPGHDIYYGGSHGGLSGRAYMIDLESTFTYRGKNLRSLQNKGFRKILHPEHHLMEAERTIQMFISECLSYISRTSDEVRAIEMERYLEASTAQCLVAEHKPRPRL